MKLPSFSGDYQSWTEFKHLFTSIVSSSQQLSNIEKLHYLKNSISGSAANIISGLPMTEETFNEAWEKLVQKYENKRKLIFSHVTNIMTDIKPSRNTSTSVHLNALVDQVDTALRAIRLLNQSTENWDVLLIHQVVKQLDDITRERWESSLENNQIMPTYAQLKEFIVVRIRTLENLEPSSTSQRSSQSTPINKPSTKAAVSNITTSSKYTCDCCGQSHFIVTCATFRALSPVERLQIVKKKSLCYNCMGRHSARSCRMQMTCTICKKIHHTMIYAAITAQPSPSTSTTEQ